MKKTGTKPTIALAGTGGTIATMGDDSLEIAEYSRGIDGRFPWLDDYRPARGPNP